MKPFESAFPVHRFQPGSPEIPPELWKVPRPPGELYVQGDPKAWSLFERLPRRGFSIVGSRECQPRSLREIQGALSQLKGFDLVIVTGLARGIDAHAHQRALEEGFPTIAILGCGIDWSYPEENDPLRTRILESGGLVVSEFSPDAQAKPDHFIRRNRLIASWSSATWVVEAGPRSGAINTATWTKKMDRPCFVTPCYPGDPTLEGNQRLLETRQVIEGLIRPFWSARSLGEVWLELESFFSSQNQGVLPLPQPRLQGASPSENLSEKICSEIRRQTLSQGGIPLEQLASWSQENHHHPTEFFSALRGLLENERLTVQAGSIVWNCRP